MQWLAAFLLLGHYLILCTLCIFGMHRLYITYQSNHRYQRPEPKREFSELPLVTVQLPMYNEKFVAQRLIDTAAALNYPKHLLQIQILDDSTDETSVLIAARVAHHKRNGVWIEHHTRSDRSGYKAGALAAATPTVAGDFIAIFDADFLPPADFLFDTIHFFTDPEVGMVQGRWEHLNRNASLLTRIQGIMLDAHFNVEQSGRNAQQVFFNFNGTAGIWRRTAIDAAGGWQADTLTEDLDLSYRAQLEGYRFIYLRDLECLSELPADMSAFKNQQHRWAKGGTEVMRKLLRKILRAPVNIATKCEAILHLTSNLTHLLIFVDCVVFLIPAIVLRQTILPYPPIWVDALLFSFGGLSHFYFYLSAQKKLGRSLWDKVWLVPLLMATTVGISRSNGSGVLEALTGRKSAFVRTPKRGNVITPDAANNYLARLKMSGQALECSLGFCFLITLIWCLNNQVYEATPFISMFCFGFFYTGTANLRRSLTSRFSADLEAYRLRSDA